MELGAFYQCYKRPEAVIFALTKFREHYPDSDVLLVSDGGYNYEHLARHFNCIYKHEQTNTGNGVATIYDTPGKLLILIERWKEAAQKIRQDYILVLEDDVYVMGRITESLDYDINALGSLPSKLGVRMTQALKLRNRSIPLFKLRLPFSGFGGSVFKKSAILNYLDNAEAIIRKMSRYERKPIQIYSSDKWLSIIVLYNGGTLGDFEGYCETRYPDYRKRLAKQDIKILHQYKEIYGKALTDKDLEILGNYK